MNSTNNIKKTVIYIFIISVVLMTFVSLLAVWGVLEDEVMWKSIVTIGILAGASGIIGYAADRLDSNRAANSIARTHSAPSTSGQAFQDPNIIG